MAINECYSLTERFNEFFKRYVVVRGEVLHFIEDTVSPEALKIKQNKSLVRTAGLNINCIAES